MLFQRQLRKQALGDIVITAPVGGPFGKGELVHIMAAGFTGDPFGLVIDLRSGHGAGLAAIKGNLVDLLLGGPFRHHGNEAQAEQLGEIGFGNRRRPGRAFHDHRVRPDRAIADAIEIE